MNTRLIELLKELRPNIKGIGIFENDIKEVSFALGLSYKQLANEIGLSESSLRSAASTNKISRQLSKALELYVETVLLKRKLRASDIFKKSLKQFLKEDL